MAVAERPCSGPEESASFADPLYLNAHLGFLPLFCGAAHSHPRSSRVQRTHRPRPAADSETGTQRTSVFGGNASGAKKGQAMYWRDTY